MGWVLFIAPAVAVAVVVAWWNAKAAVLGGLLAAAALAASFGYWINHWDECSPCPRAAGVVATINTFLVVLAPALLVFGVAATLVRAGVARD